MHPKKIENNYKNSIIDSFANMLKINCPKTQTETQISTIENVTSFHISIYHNIEICLFFH